MTKKDYQLIAEVIHDWLHVGESVFTQALALRLSQENPKFDSYKFLQACKVESKDKNIQHLNKIFGL